MKREGKRTREWESTRRKLKAAFERIGLTACEFRLDSKCTPRFFLTWAHPTKRRFITTQEQLEEVALACCHCHKIIEAKSHEEMARIVRESIANRETQPKL